VAADRYVTAEAEAVHRCGVLSWGSSKFHPCLRPLKTPGCTSGEGRQASRQPTDASAPEILIVSRESSVVRDRDGSPADGGPPWWCTATLLRV